MLVTQNELPNFEFILRFKIKHDKLGFQSFLKYILLLRKRNGKNETKKIRNETKRNETIWLEKRYETERKKY
jgi:hypothetical protein